MPIPPEVMFGSYELRDLRHPALGFLYEGKLIVDKTYGHASYGCAHCCGYSQSRMSPTPFNGPPNTDNTDTYQSYSVCDSSWEDFDFFTTPYSSNTTVATMSVSTMHTVAPGGAQTSGKNELLFQGNLQSPCVKTNMPGTQGVTVQPVVSTTSPAPSAVPVATAQPGGGVVGNHEVYISATCAPEGKVNPEFNWSIAQGSTQVELDSTLTGGPTMGVIGAGGPSSPPLACISSNKWVAHSCASFAQEWEPPHSLTNIPGSIEPKSSLGPGAPWKITRHPCPARAIPSSSCSPA